MIDTVRRAINIIECLSQGINGVVDISEKLNLSKATVHRTLKALEVSRIVIQDLSSRKYYLGPFIYSLTSNSAIAHQSLIACSFDDMWYLRELTGESVALQIRIKTQRLVLEELESFQKHRFTLGRDYLAPLYTGSGGIVMLSQLPREELSVFISSITLISLGPGTIQDKDKLINEVDKAREQGYAISVSTEHLGVAGISVPINNYVCPAALSIFGPENRLEDMKLHVNEIKNRGELISNKVSHIMI